MVVAVCIPRHRDVVKSLERARCRHRGIWLFEAFLDEVVLEKAIKLSFSAGLS